VSVVAANAHAAARVILTLLLSWNLREIETPGGSRSPVVVHSQDEARVVLIGLEPGQRMGDHQVHERSWVFVLDGRVTIASGGETLDAGPGWLAWIDKDERRSISTDEGARILLLLAPWPGAGHFHPSEGSP
jgi:quercetin dioxygenase-like cupin family protein